MRLKGALTGEETLHIRNALIVSSIESKCKSGSALDGICTRYQVKVFWLFLNFSIGRLEKRDNIIVTANK